MLRRLTLLAVALSACEQPPLAYFGDEDLGPAVPHAQRDLTAVPIDLSRRIDFAWDEDLPPPILVDLSAPDLTRPDLARPDLSLPDLFRPDLSMPDMAVPDMAVPDLGPDLGPDSRLPDLLALDARPPNLDGPTPVAAHCFNCLKDADETGQDCGGSCGPCSAPPAQNCADNNRGIKCGCGGVLCPGNGVGACANGLRDGTETDIDCGGATCPKCAVNGACANWYDCQSGNCVAGRCSATVPTCNDGIRNGFELDVDCGGQFCTPCADGKACWFADSSCKALDCYKNVCSAPTCNPLFKQGQTYGVVGPYAIADFDGDGKVDLAIAYKANTIGLMRGNGDGTFQNPVDSAVMLPGLLGIGTADWNGDKVVDLWATINGGRDLQLVTNKGMGAFAGMGTIANDPTPGKAVQVGDFNGDGRSDVLFWHVGNRTMTAYYANGKGDGTFGAQNIVYDTAGGNESLLDVLVEHGPAYDGWAVVVSGIGHHVVLSRFHGTFPSGPALSHWSDADPSIATAALVADLDGDGWDDELINAADIWGCVDHSASPFVHQFDKAVAWNGFAAGIQQYPDAAADLNGDGKVDYAKGNQVYCGAGDLTFQYPVTFTQPGKPVRDLNRDGKADQIASGNASITIFLNAN